MTKTITALLAAGLLVGCTQSVEKASVNFNETPKAVQTAVRASAPNAEITSVDRGTENGVEVYTIKLRMGDQTPTMVVASDGRVVSSDLAQGGPGLLDKAVTSVTGAGAIGTKFSALPPKVQESIKKNAPANVEITDIERHESDGKVVYEVQFKDKDLHPPIKVTEDGTVIAGERK